MNKNKYEPEMPDELRKYLYGDKDASRSDRNVKRPRPTQGARDGQQSKKKRPKSSKQRDPRREMGPTKSSSANTKKTTSGGVKRTSQRPSGTRPARPTGQGQTSERPTRPTSQAQTRVRTTSQSKNQVRPKSKGPNSSNINSRNRKIEDSRKKKVIKNKKSSSRGANSGGILNIIKKILAMIVYFIINLIRFIRTGGDKTKYVTNDKKKLLNFKFSKYFSIASMVVICFFTITVIFTKAQTYSVQENRDLSNKPAFSLSSYISGDYAKKYSNYISDQFPFRNSFVKEKAKMDLALGKKEINGVYIGKDGYLMEGFNSEPKSQMKAKADAINIMAKRYPNINMSVMLVPNKCEILSNLMPKNAPVASQKKYLAEFKPMLNDNVKFVDLMKTFEANKDGTQLYFRTDHHWTQDGAYKAYDYYMNSIGISPYPESNFRRSLATNNFLGSLYYKNGADIGEPEDLFMYLKSEVYPILVHYFDTGERTTTLYDANKLNGRDPYEVFTGGNHSELKIRTAVDSDRKLLIFKDSYANSMLPFLINNFSEITVVDLRYYKDKIEDIFNNNEITDVLVLYNINTFSTDSSILNLEDLKNVSSDGEGKLKTVTRKDDSSNSKKSSKNSSTKVNSKSDSSSSDNNKKSSSNDSSKKNNNKNN